VLFIKRKNINFNPRSIIGDTGWALLFLLTAYLSFAVGLFRRKK